MSKEKYVSAVNVLEEIERRERRQRHITQLSKKQHDQRHGSKRGRQKWEKGDRRSNHRESLPYLWPWPLQL